jgi:hypothetical protein
MVGELAAGKWFYRKGSALIPNWFATGRQPYTAPGETTLAPVPMAIEPESPPSSIPSLAPRLASVWKLMSEKYTCRRPRTKACAADRRPRQFRASGDMATVGHRAKLCPPAAKSLLLRRLTSPLRALPLLLCPACLRRPTLLVAKVGARIGCDVSATVFIFFSHAP